MRRLKEEHKRELHQQQTKMLRMVATMSTRVPVWAEQYAWQRETMVRDMEMAQTARDQVAQGCRRQGTTVLAVRDPTTRRHIEIRKEDL